MWWRWHQRRWSRRRRATQERGRRTTKSESVARQRTAIRLSATPGCELNWRWVPGGLHGGWCTDANVGRLPLPVCSRRYRAIDIRIFFTMSYCVCVTLSEWTDTPGCGHRRYGRPGNRACAGGPVGLPARWASASNVKLSNENSSHSMFKQSVQ